MEMIISGILTALGIYLLIGILFTVFFIFKGLAIVDPGTEGGSRFFKLLLVPGLVAFWVYFLRKWIKS